MPIVSESKEWREAHDTERHQQIKKELYPFMVLGPRLMAQKIKEFKKKYPELILVQENKKVEGN